MRDSFTVCNGQSDFYFYVNFTPIHYALNLSGVLTKVDLINPGGEDEVLSVVTNVRKPLALGYIMVKNRSQLDLNNNMTTSQAR